MTTSMELIALKAAEPSRVVFSTIAELASAICEGHLESWSQRMLKSACIQMEVIGREHIKDGEEYIVITNHQSRYDIPVLYQALCIPMQMMDTKEITRVTRLAVKNGRRILPVTIDGTPRIASNDSRIGRKNPVRVTISAPIDPVAYVPDKIQNLIGIIQDAIGRHLSDSSGFAVSKQ